MERSLEKQLAKWLKQQKTACGFYLKLSILLGTLTGMALMLQAYLISSILHGIIMQELQLADLSHLFLAFLVLIPVRALLAYGKERSAFAAGRRLRKNIRQAVLDKLDDLGPAYIKGKPAGAWASIVLEQVEDLHDYYAHYLPQTLLAAFIPLCILVVVFPLNWAAGLILLVTAPLIPIFMIMAGMGAASANRKHFKALAQLSGHFMDRLRGFSSIKLFNQGGAETQKIEQASEGFRQKTMAVLRLAFLSSAVLEFFAALSIALLAVYFGFSYLGNLDFGHYGGGISLLVGVFILMLAPEFYQPLRDMGTHYHAKAQAIGAAEELMALLNYQPERAEQKQAIQPIDWQQQLEIQAEQLSVFSHDGTRLLGPISFELKHGQHLALVGPSGSGKSTLLNALLGFLPYEGKLSINGVPLKNIELSQWRAHLAWLGQEPQLFHGTVRDNVALAQPSMAEEEVEEVLARAKVLDFVQAQPLALQHPIAEQMAGISVGQAQRIALARALAQTEAQLFLLDEPTASLDRHNEQAIWAALQEACAHSASITVSHRLDELIHMDHILVLEKGRLVQQGNYAALSQEQGLFQDMLQQMARFDDVPAPEMKGEA